MSQTIIPANFERNEYEKAVFQDAIIYTLTVAGATVTKITNAAITTFGIAAGFNTTATTILFDSLVGNLPWSSYSKFPSTQPRATSGPGLPSGSLPRAGAITITEGGVGTEVMYYGSLTWAPAAGPLPATAGAFTNVKRASAFGGTSYTFTGAATGTFTNVIPVRERFLIWNRTGAILYVGASANIDNTPTNAIEIPTNSQHGIWLEPLQDIWVYSAGGGDINIAEYR